MLWVLVIAVIVGLLIWANIVGGMNVRDRIEVALEIVRASNFSEAEGFAAAALEDPDLIGWVKDGNDCVMLFQSRNNNETREVVDFVSSCFHPGLVIHYENGRATRTDKGEIEDEHVRSNAAQLLREVRQAISVSKSADDFGFRE